VHYYLTFWLIWYVVLCSYSLFYYFCCSDKYLGVGGILVWVVGSLVGDMHFMLTLTTNDDSTCSRIRMIKMLHYILL
jgi:hypothetical protein